MDNFEMNPGEDRGNLEGMGNEVLILYSGTSG